MPVVRFLSLGSRRENIRHGSRDTAAQCQALFEHQGIAGARKARLLELTAEQGYGGINITSQIIRRTSGGREGGKGEGKGRMNEERERKEEDNKRKPCRVNH